MAYPQKQQNPLFAKMRSDGVLAPGQQGSGVGDAMRSTFANLRGGTGEQTDFGAINAAANNPMNAGIDPNADPNLFSAIQPPSLANLGLHPSGGPTSSFAPTGLRERAIAAGGAPVTGFGGAMVMAAPNSRGGTGFSLSQYAGPDEQGNIPGAIDPNPSPAAMQFLQDGIAPQNPGAFPRLGAPAAAPQASPFQQPSNEMFRQQQPGLGAFIPKGTPEQIKAQLGVIQPLQKMQQEAQERAAIAAAHGPNVKDGLATYLANGGRDIGVIDSFKKNTLAERNLNMKQGAADEKRAAADKAEQEKASQVSETSNNVIGTIDQILPKINWNTVGPIGSLKSHISGTDAYDLAKLRDTVKSNVGLTQLQQMRDASKTGASGFGQLSEKELDVLQSSIASLDQAQRPEQFREALTKVRDHFSAWKTSYEAGQLASAGKLTPADQARAILAIRKASQKK